jgi:two-component system sensor histidine kinase UhpB
MTIRDLWDRLLIQRLKKTPLFYRVLVGNSIVIIVGAIGGILLTRHITVMGNLGLIILFTFLGIPFTLLVNYAIIWTAMRPLRQLQVMIENVRTGQPTLIESTLIQSDPEIRQLVDAINATLDRLQKRTLQLRALSERAINANEEERKRIARGLHDDTAQALSALIVKLERASASLPSDIPALHEDLRDAHLLATRALEDLRKIVFDLRPSMLDDLGLIPAISWYARSNLEPSGIEVHFEVADENIRLPPHKETLLFRIAQEAVNNILKHAHAGSATIRLEKKEKQIDLYVEDDGKGFDVDETVGEAVRKKRLGLIGIKERASLVGGEVLISSAPNSGTRLYVSVPLLTELNEVNDGREGQGAFRRGNDR